MKLKKFLLPFLAVALILGFLLPFPSAQTRVKSYYSGDAIFYHGNTVIATTNTGELELFKVQAGQTDIVKFVSFASYNPRFDQPQDFSDVLLRQEGATLYAYAVDGRSLFKYDISDLQYARLVTKVQDNSWDWFGTVHLVDDYVATTGSQGVKLWNDDLVVVDSYKIITPGDNSYNTKSSDSHKYLFTVHDDKISIFNREDRKTITDIPLTFKWGSDWFKRKVYNDRDNDVLFVVDDEAVRKINFRGEIINSFKHISHLGYDVVPSSDPNYIYFSDGYGVVKLRTSDLKVIDYKYTTSLGGGQGWAMGMKVIQDSQGEKLVIFNNSSIIILDSNLEPLKKANQEAYVIATKQETFPDVFEPIALSIDKNRAAAGSTIVLSGKGFGANEIVNISFVDNNFTTNTDAMGRFSLPITIPAVKKQKADFMVKGLSTAYKYSLGFEIE